MNFLSKADRKRSGVLFLFLGISLGMVPFVDNPAVRSLLTVLLCFLFLNMVTVSIKLISHYSHLWNGRRSD